LAQNSFTEKLL